MEEKTLKKVLSILKEFTDKSSIKEELRYVYYNDKRKELVATDTIRMIVVEIDLVLDGNYFIDVNKKGSIFEYPEIKLIGSYNAYKEKERIYPKYENIIPNKIEKNEYDIKYLDLKIKDVVVNVGVITDTKTIVGYTKKYDKLNDNADNAKIYLDKDIPEKCPILIEWNSNLTNTIWKMVFMPNNI